MDTIESWFQQRTSCGTCVDDRPEKQFSHLVSVLENAVAIRSQAPEGPILAEARRRVSVARNAVTEAADSLRRQLAEANAIISEAKSALPDGTEGPGIVGGILHLVEQLTQLRFETVASTSRASQRESLGEELEVTKDLFERAKASAAHAQNQAENFRTLWLAARDTAERLSSASGSCVECERLTREIDALKHDREVWQKIRKDDLAAVQSALDKAGAPRSDGPDVELCVVDRIKRLTTAPSDAEPLPQFVYTEDDAPTELRHELWQLNGDRYKRVWECVVDCGQKGSPRSLPSDMVNDIHDKFGRDAVAAIVKGSVSKAEFLSRAKAAPIATRQPDGYAYRYPSHHGGTVVRFSNGEEINACKPTEAVPYWLGEAPIAAGKDAVGELVRAASAFATKIALVHDSDAYKAVWWCAHNHIGQYCGLTYTEELAALNAAIAAFKAGGAQ